MKDPRTVGGIERQGDTGRQAGATAFAAVGAPARTLHAVQRLVLVLVGAGLLTASAYLSVPFYPVPLTMQTLAVLLIGGLLGPSLGVSSVAAYLALGAAGAPVFHNGVGGVAVLVGPTGGYLVGFLAAAFAMGMAVRWAYRVAGRDRARGHASAAEERTAGLAGWAPLGVLVAGVSAATALVYAVGVPWLALFPGDGLAAAFTLGAVPFLLGDLLKAAVAVAALRLGGEATARRGLHLH